MEKGLKIYQEGDFTCLSGTIDEQADFSALRSLQKRALKLNLKNIERINSAGVRLWIRQSKDFPAETEYHECSEAFVDQMNMIYNFTLHGKIVSFYAPYTCPHCDIDERILLTPDALIKGQKESDKLRAPPIQSRRCNHAMTFDGDEDEYFLFLTR